MLGVSDMSRSLAFYRETLGLSVRSETPGFAFLDTGPVTLCLSEPHAKLGGFAGAIEVVLAVQGVRRAYAELTKNGVVFMSEPMNVTGDSWAANFRDPDGHLLSVFGPE